MSRARFPRSDHCDGTHFFNPRQHINRGFRDVWRWKRTSRPARWPASVTIDPAPLPPAPRDGTVTATWLGHATVLLQTRHGALLTDPMFSDRAGPFGRFGPRRCHPPAHGLADLPPIDAILLSHDHYDHCDLPSLRRLAIRSSRTRILTPLGNGELARRAGFSRERICELDWWEAAELRPGLHVRAVPARHWSNRLSGPRNGRLWSGFFVHAAGRTVYFAGDTGYDPVMFVEIAERCGSPDLAVLPIGAYEPRWFMAAQHCNPAEAVQIHRELGAGTSIGVHWGCFPLTDEPREAPGEALAAARIDQAVPERAFPLLPVGGSVHV